VLDLILQSHGRWLAFVTPPKAVVSGSARADDPGKVDSRWPPLPLLPGFARRFGTAIGDDSQGMLLETLQDFFKKSISIACWPILRSSSAMRSASNLA
jgi:hypothetical protein